MNVISILASIAVTLRSDDAKLARVKFLVFLVGVFFFISFVLDAYRFRTRNSTIKILLLIFDTINDSLLTYTSGMIQNAPFTNEVFAIWAVLLYTSRSDTDYITAYSVPNAYARRRTELRELFLSVLLGNINATLGHNFKLLLWILWSVRPLQVFARIFYYDVALYSYSHGRNSEFVAEYTRQECLKKRTYKPDTMVGYGYLVSGENAQGSKHKAPDYQFTMEAFNSTKCVTVEKIWQCRGRLLLSWDRDNKIKDTCLSYAFYKILRCQRGNILSRVCYDKMQKLVFEGILREGEDAERVFRVFEIEMAFFNDYERTRYPIIIWYGLPVINLFTCLITITISLFLASNLHNMEFGDGDLTHYIGHMNVDRFITYLLLSMIVLKEIWEIVLYSFSDWTKIKIVCKYVEGKWWVRNRIFEHIAWYLCSTSVAKSWCGEISQYSLLESFHDRPWLKKILHHASLHLIKRPIEGGKLLKRIQINKEVKVKIVEALRSMNTTGKSMNYMRSVYRDPIRDEFKWACSQESCSEVILVWHIATGICEIELSISRQKKREIPWYLSPLYWIKNLFSSHKPFLVDVESLEGDLRSHYITANSISRYCAYLLITAPELLPDNEIFPRLNFDSTISNARKVLGSCNSLETIYRRLMERGASLQGEQNQSTNPGQEERGEILEEEQDQSANPGQEERDKKTINIVEIGARLGYALITKMEEPGDRWKMLSQYWANLLLYLAPCIPMGDHESHLEKGGEFITILWALFRHCGIFEQGEEEEDAANESETQGPVNVTGTVQSEEEGNNRPGDAHVADHQNLKEED